MTFWVVWPNDGGGFFLSDIFSHSLQRFQSPTDNRVWAAGESDEKQNKCTEMLLEASGGMDAPKRSNLPIGLHTNAFPEAIQGWTKITFQGSVHMR